MKAYLKKKTAQILALSLMLAMAVVFVPQMAAPAYANNGDPAIGMGSGILAENAGKDAAQKVFYGNRAWYVIEYDQKDGDGDVVSYTDPSGATKPLYREGTATLLQEGVGDHTVFNSLTSQPYSCAYGWLDSDSENPQTPSNLRSFIDSRYLTGYNNEGTQVAAYLSAGEQAAINPRRLDGGGEHANSQNYDKNKIYGAAVESACLWPLSDAEASVLPNSIKVVGTGVYWWLRSPGASDIVQQAVNDYGTITYGFFLLDMPLGVRPAFDLNLEAVLFTSAAEDGKSDEEGTMTQVGTNTTGTWKLTLLDDGTIAGLSGHAGFTVDTTKLTYDYAAGTVTVPYGGAATGDNEFISAVIKDSSGNIKYYGKIAKASSAADASVTINALDKLGDSDTLYVFNEQCNGDMKTDYASKLQEVTVPKRISYKVTFKVKNGAWNDGTTKDKTVTLSRYDNEDKALVLQDSDIPAVGNKPNANLSKRSRATRHFPGQRQV